MNKIYLLLTLSISVFIPISAIASSEASNGNHSIQTYKKIALTGHAYDQETGGLLYTEHHYHTSKYEHEVEYREVNGDIFATKKILYQSSYLSPDFQQENWRNGEQISTQRKKGNEESKKNILVTYKEDTDSDLTSAMIKHSGHLIIDAGFNNFIKQNWEKLINGNTMTVNYLIPSLLDTYELNIQKTTCQDDLYYCFSISSSSFFINLISSDLKLTYDTVRYRDNNQDREEYRLISFEGRSNICDQEGEYQDVEIKYSYPQKVLNQMNPSIKI